MKKRKCINVETRFSKFRLGYDDPSFSGTSDPWLKRIECRSGFIAPHGDDSLIACTSSSRSNATRILKEDSRTNVVQDADDGVNAVFDVKDWKFVFETMGAKRK